MVRRLGLKEQATKDVTIMFAQGSGQASSVVTNVSFEVGDTSFVEGFTVCELNFWLRFYTG